LEIIKSYKSMQQYADRIRSKQETIALVPTMGFFHKGHLSLMKKAKEVSNHLVVSLFVNPTQFAPDEDFDSYPRDTERDLALAEKESVNVMFMPEREELYSSEFQTYVNLEKLPNHLCGLSRPTFFRGVATVVSKLFNIIKPHYAIFGQKDFQQLAVIRQMVKDLNFDIEIIGVPTFRESDGLAMSSRNKYLDSNQRKTALCLFQSLEKAFALVQAGETDPTRIIAKATSLIESHAKTSIDYIKICDPITIEDVAVIKKRALMALAVNVGKTRLIDNRILEIKT